MRHLRTAGLVVLAATLAAGGALLVGVASIVHAVVNDDGDWQ